MRGFRWWMMVCLLLLCGSAMAEGALCVVSDGVALLLTESGEVVVPEGVHQEIHPLGDERFAFGRMTEGAVQFALGDLQGNLLTEAVYETLTEQSGVLLFRQNDRLGAMTMDGEPLVPAEYTQLIVCGENRFLATRTDPNDDGPDELWRISVGAEPEPTGVWTTIHLTEPGDGRMPFYSPSEEAYGYMDDHGEVVIAPVLSYAGKFENGSARASLEEKFGLLNAQGQWLVAPEYDELSLGDSLAAAIKGRSVCTVIRRVDGAECFQIQGKKLECAMLGDRLLALDGDRLRVYDSDGTVLLEADRNVSVSRGVGNQLILSDGDWGADCVSIYDPLQGRLERRDQWLLPLEEDRYLFMSMNVAAYNSGVLGEIRYSCDYDSMRFGVMDGAGNEILPAQYSEIRLLGEHRYLLIADEGLRVSDENGIILWEKWIVE